MKIFVGNMSYNTNEDALRNAFAVHGNVEEVTVMMDRETGRPRGFGFVTMTDGAGRVAIDALNGHDLDGRTITVSEARPKAGGGGRDGQRRGGW